ncbi:hypothetical protein IRZ83_17040 [Flavobacterium sp. JLP]|uniref:hypothetical protein n=1 Tax=Flavobacterium sp. JLP TaxID=2783793 RepID=UPI00188DC5BA|nr:hypothetical protein [Flavobacterium sp. JLP]MBF4508386.1 hypothetical protein [Flavobacterium sp. JLP]
MAKKKINIILIIVVLGLWGTVGYRAINRQFSSSEMILEKENQHGNTTINQINKDTFKLEKINRDPFLNKEFQTAVAVPRKILSHSYYKPVKKAVTPTAPKSDPNLHWPALTYYGYIGSKNEELVLLKIDSKVCKLKVNDPINGLIVKKRYKDSIEVSFNTQTKMIRLK